MTIRWIILKTLAHHLGACCYLTGNTAASAKLLQSCPTLCDPMDKGNPPRDTQHNCWAGLKDWGFTSEANRLNAEKSLLGLHS